ncbi:MAG TPA: hypothetical protein VGQ75_08830 [Thermoanaerobaculia bacterium]|nr:hypothetical protein [Thermoanaerobaculia bacterium]
MNRRPTCIASMLGAALFLLVASPSHGATWWRLPLWGAEVKVFAVDPFDANTLYCGTSRGNFYGSTDGGSTWTALRQGAAFPGYIATGLITDSKVPGRLWASLAGQYQGGLVARSDDRGANWTVLARWRMSIATRALALAPLTSDDPPVLAVGGDDGVRLSTDGGETWTLTGDTTPGLYQVESLAFAPGESKTLYAGTWRQAFRTRDGGRTWSRIAEGMVLDASVYAWDFDSSDPKDIWVSTCGWVYRTHDGGDRWTRFKTGFTNRRSHNVRRDPNRRGVIYAGTVGGLHRSTDGGETWSRVSRDTLVVTALEVDRRTGRLFVGTEGEGVFYSDDGGATLAPGSVGLAEGRVSDLIPDPKDPSRVFFFRAYAGGESGVWEAKGMRVRRLSLDSLPPAAALTAFRDPAGATVLLLSSFSGLRISFDGGERWSVPERPPAGTPLALYGTEFGSPVLVTTAGVFRTFDGRGFARLPGSPDAPSSAEILADSFGTAILEIRTADGASRWDGSSWDNRRHAMLSGGKFLDAYHGDREPLPVRTPVREVDGNLVWEESGRRRAVRSPRPGLSIATTLATAEGRLYVGTAGDGLFLFEP